MGRGHKIGEGGKDIEFAWWLFLSFSDTDRIGIDLKVILKETEPLLVILWSASEEQKNLLLGTNLVAFVE